MLIKLSPIKEYDGFKNVYMHGKKFYAKNLTAIIVFVKTVTPSNGQLNLHTIDYGVTIGKRIAPKAVIRNRVKRLLRHGMYNLLKETNNSKLIVIDKIILSYQYAPEHPKQIGLTDIMPAIKQTLEQAYFFYSKKNNSL